MSVCEAKAIDNDVSSLGTWTPMSLCEAKAIDSDLSSLGTCKVPK
jgi:hypothetical protein